ncbi:MAG: hypothetical protein IPL61_27515 [Myxococcales bacterium]|nr:hypothetical protein [Myxococcales bacterium]
MIRWLTQLSNFWKGFLQAVLAAVIFYGGAVLEQWIQQQDLAPGGIVRGIALFLMILLAVLLYVGMRSHIEAAERIDADRRAELAYAASRMDYLVAEQVKDLSTKEWCTMSPDEAIGKAFASSRRLELIVKAVHDLFDAKHSAAGVKKVDFEVTFMTKSLLDDGVTIAAYANSTGRAPISMNKRQANAALYKDTEVGRMYAAEKPSLKIIEDTAVPEARYAEIYPGQKERIRSSVVCPVLNGSNVMLGALVVHCDSQRFFKVVDSGHWGPLLEMFAKRLALERIRLEIAHREGAGAFQRKPF